MTDPLASELLRLDAQADRCLARARRHARRAVTWRSVELLANLAMICVVALSSGWVWAALATLFVSTVAGALWWGAESRRQSFARRAEYLTGRMSGLVAAATAPDAAVGRRSVIVRAAWDAARKGAAS